MKTRTMWVTVAVVAVLVLMAGGAGAIPPRQAPEATVGDKINYQGRLTDPDGTPLDGTFPMRFQIYDDPGGGTMLWDSGVINVGVYQGLFNVELAVDPPDFNGQALWLRIYVDGEWLWPRQELVPVPYALSLRPGAQINGPPPAPDGAVLDVVVDGFYTSGKAVLGSTATGSAICGDSTGGYGLRGYSEDGNAISAYSNAKTAGVFHSNEGYGIRVNTDGNNHWDHAGYFSADWGYGVYAVSDENMAVVGEAGDVSGYWRPGGQVGVVGIGEDRGVFGSSRDREGVYGISENDQGVYGESETDVGVYGSTGSDAGMGVVGVQTGYWPSDRGSYMAPGGLFGGRNGVIGITKYNNGVAVIGYNRHSNGWAGVFTTSAGHGVFISTPVGKTALSVLGGSKSAVVRTRDGSRLLYSEESTEVWFSDYGFGELQDGRAVVSIDPLFAQTVNLEEAYHVFIQVYGDAEVYVTNRTSAYFEVQLRDGDPNVEFSYRIVAKRLGYEEKRLERARWADHDVNLYPEQKVSGQALQPGVDQAGGQR